MKVLSRLITLLCAATITLACSKPAEIMSFVGVGTYSAESTGQTVNVSFRTNCDWTIVPGEDASWLSFSATSGTSGGAEKYYKLVVTVAVNSEPEVRTAKVNLVYGRNSQVKVLTFNQKAWSALKPCTVTGITDDMLFSTVVAGTSTSVCQGFDFDETKTNMYYSQVTAGYKNTISWTKREAITTSTTLAANKMILYYFSHGNNIHYEKDGGSDYLWIANYGTRDSEDKYTNPQILSRIKLVAGSTLKNTQTTDNYYFGTKTIHASFDVENDLLAIYSQGDGYTMKVYRLSDVLKAPVKNITLPYSLKYGGGTSKVAPDAEWSGTPTVSAHDCTTLTPLHTFVYNYPKNGRGWQTYCLKGDKAYFFLFYSTANNGMTYQSVIDVLDMNGNIVKTNILQPFADNMTDLMRYNFTDNTYKYMENEGILIRDGVLYLLYVGKLKSGTNDFRRPIVFNFDASCLE